MPIGLNLARDDESSTELGDGSLTTDVHLIENATAPSQWPVNNSVEDSSHASQPAIDDDASGHVLYRDYTGMFEGPEKTLEVVFRRISDDVIDTRVGELHSSTSNIIQSNVSSSGGAQQDYPRIGLRRLDRPALDSICARARCTILSSVSNQFLDAYVLSESSLFIYPYMLVLKTCGTTTLLRCIAVLIDLGKQCGLEIDWVGYSRKNFNFPGDQAFPHQSFHQELDYLYSHRNLCQRLNGNGYTLGPVTGDHWFVFVADHTVRAQALDVDTDRVLNLMMFDIDESVAKLFYYDQYEPKLDGESNDEAVARISQEQTEVSGIRDLCPGALIDPRAFEPCGYSMNAVLFRSYSTIHITPESGSSYVSFETNQKVRSYKSLINNVIRTFRPRRFVMTLMADSGGLKQVTDNPLTDSGADARIEVVMQKDKTKNNVPRDPFEYKRSSQASIQVEDDCNYLMGNWVLLDDKSNGECSAAEASSDAMRLRRLKRRGLSVS